jgi:hypothetical protein
MIKEIKSARQVIEDMVEGAEKVLDELSQLKPASTKKLGE